MAIIKNTKRKKKPGETIKETSRSVGPKRHRTYFHTVLPLVPTVVTFAAIFLLFSTLPSISARPFLSCFMSPYQSPHSHCLHEIPPATTVKYLGMHLDTKLNWKDDIIKKRKQMDIRYKELYWLVGRKSNLSTENKLLLYKSIITPVWTYGIELWGCASKSNIVIIQRCPISQSYSDVSLKY